MSTGTDEQGGESTDPRLKGWDKGAFWYPTLDRRGALLGVFLLLLVLHFNELFGLSTSTALVFGWLPVNMAYYIGLNVLHVAFLVLLYYNWPDPKDEDVLEPTPVQRDTAAAPAAAEGD